MGAFHTQGLAWLQPQSRRPKRTRLVREAAKCAQRRALLHTSPRTLGQPRRTWTRRCAAEVCWEGGLTPDQGSIEHLRQALTRLGVSWPRAKRWMTSPDPQDARHNSGATA
jgi:hypothetical protein